MTLNSIDISKDVREKNGKKYLPWSAAWTYVKTYYPDAVYNVVKTDSGQLYHTDGKTCYVETSVTIANETQSEQLAVFDYRNQPIAADAVTYMDVQKSLKRCLAKNCALFGLGLSLWLGEELSDNAKTKKKEDEKKNAELISIQNKIISVAKEKIKGGKKSEEIYSVIQGVAGVRNPKDIEDAEAAREVLQAVMGVQ